MAIKFQYNKTSLQQLEKQLKVRVRTLPIIKNKESALRMELEVIRRFKPEGKDSYPNSVLTDYAIMEKFTMMVRMHTKVMRRNFGTTPTDASSF